MRKTVSVSQASRYLGRSPSYLRSLEENGILLPDERTEGGHRRYSVESLDGYLKRVASGGICILYCGIPETDFPASRQGSIRQQCIQALQGFGITDFEDGGSVEPSSGFYFSLPKLMAQIVRPEVRRIAFSSPRIVPGEALAVLSNCCLAHGTQVLFLDIV